MVLNSCILFWSLINGIDPSLTTAVIKVESNGNPYALGKMGDSGLMQIRKRYVPETKLQLFNSCTNVMRGTEILKKAKESCKNCLNYSWISAYNVGTTGFKRIRHPHKFPYYLKIQKAMQ